MEAKAQQIADILADYENNRMTAEHVLDWVAQFDEGDQEFILDELTVIFKETYFSKMKCKSLINLFLTKLAEQLQYADVVAMLRDTVFLDVQPEHKSQKELLALLDEILQETYGLTRVDCGQFARHYLYLDDVLSTGNKACTDLQHWLKAANEIAADQTNFDYLKANNIKLTVCVFAPMSGD
ncbi:hypothetical protein [Arcticibacter sp. MXS-1]|uniref:phosphoribosyltransferase-like protein n=1 Tax=Arcticibacter sp. MXS-1 TaxID=3341726 RepID=UPI0035A8AB3C